MAAVSCMLLTTVREVGAARLVPGVLWTTFAFSGIIGFARSFQTERLRDSLTALVLAVLFVRTARPLLLALRADVLCLQEVSARVRHDGHRSLRALDLLLTARMVGADEALQIAGGNGFMREFPYERALRSDPVPPMHRDGDDLICESVETRVFCVRDEKDRRRIHAIAVPEDIRRLCE